MRRSIRPGTGRLERAGTMGIFDIFKIGIGPSSRQAMTPMKAGLVTLCRRSLSQVERREPSAGTKSSA